MTTTTTTTTSCKIFLHRPLCTLYTTLKKGPLECTHGYIDTVTAAAATTTDDDDNNNAGTISNLEHNTTVVLTQSLQYLQPQAIKSS